MPLFVYSFLCGWTNEAFVVGLAGAYFFYYATHLKSLTTQRCAMLAGFFLGTLFLVFGMGFAIQIVFHLFRFEPRNVVHEGLIQNMRRLFPSASGR